MTPAPPDDGATEEEASTPADSGICSLPTNDLFNRPLASKWRLRRNATILSAGIQLTRDMGDQLGQLYWDDVMSFDRFEVTFGYRINTSVGNYPADGMGFAWLEGASMPVLGGVGASLGIQGAAGFAVIVDTFPYTGSASDPATPHIALRNTQSFAILANTPVIDKLDDGLAHTIKVRVVAGQVTITLDGANVLNHTIAGYAAAPGHFSFSAGTGGYRSQHVLTSATLRVGSAGPCAVP